MNISSAFVEAWSTARASYTAGLVNSECTLHSLIYGEVRARLPNHVVLCEPQMNVERHGCFVPDLVVLEGTSIAAIAEFKFVPNGYPVYELDLRKLAILAECGHRFRLRLDPKSGELTDDLFGIHYECKLVFAAIGKHDAVAVDRGHLETAMSQFGGRFLPLLMGTRV